MKALAALVMLCSPLAYTTRVHAWLSSRLASRHPPEPARPGWCDDCGRSYIDHATHERIAHIAAPAGPTTGPEERHEHEHSMARGEAARREPHRSQPANG